MMMMMMMLRYHDYYYAWIFRYIIGNYAYLRFIKVKFCYERKMGVNIIMHVRSFYVVYKFKLSLQNAVRPRGGGGLEWKEAKEINKRWRIVWGWGKKGEDIKLKTSIYLFYKVEKRKIEDTSLGIQSKQNIIGSVYTNVRDKIEIHRYHNHHKNQNIFEMQLMVMMMSGLKYCYNYYHEWS